VDGPVEGAVAAAVEAVAHGVSAAGWYRAGAGEGGERGVVAATAGVGERRDGLGGGDGSDAGALGETGCEVLDNGLQLDAVVFECASGVVDDQGEAADLGVADGLFAAGVAGEATAGQAGEGGVGECGTGELTVGVVAVAE
jgi:hypothetical protein